MTRQTQSTELDSIVELLAEHGFDGIGQAIEILLNEAMKLQRSEALGASPYEPGRAGAVITPPCCGRSRDPQSTGRLR